MSATRRAGSERGGGGRDFFATPSWCVRRLLEAVPLRGGTWIEPSAGDGAIIRAVNQVRDDVNWLAWEIRDDCRTSLVESGIAAERIITADFLDLHVPSLMGPVSVVIGNPPFSHAREFAQQCYGFAFADTVVCLLLPLSFAASKERWAFMRKSQPCVYVLPNRPSFSGEGRTDQAEYAWYIWRRQHYFASFGVLGLTPASERKAAR